MKISIGVVGDMEVIAILEVAARLAPRIHAVERFRKILGIVPNHFLHFDGAKRRRRRYQSPGSRVTAATLYSRRFIRAARQRLRHLPELPPEKLGEVGDIPVMPGTLVLAVVFPIATALIGLARLALVRAAGLPPTRLLSGAVALLCRL